MIERVEYEVQGFTTRQTACSLYVTTPDGDEVASIRPDEMSDELLAKMEAEAGTYLVGQYCGGTLDGQPAW